MNDAHLAEAIATHPQLWQSMGRAWMTRRMSDWARGRNSGMIAALCIVGGFDTSLVERRLALDFGA